MFKKKKEKENEEEEEEKEKRNDYIWGRELTEKGHFLE